MIAVSRITNKLRVLFAEHCYGSSDDVIFKQSLDKPPPAIINQELSVVDADWPTVEKFVSSHAELRSFRSRAKSYFENNFKATLAMLDGEPVGYVWWTDAQIGTEECQHPQIHRYNIDMSDGAVWGFDMHILVAHRGESTASDFFGLFRRHLHEAGYSTLSGAAQKENRPALWLHRIQRFEEVSTVHSVELFGLFLYVDIDGGRWYLKNGRSGKQKFDYRCIYESKKKRDLALKSNHV